MGILEFLRRQAIEGRAEEEALYLFVVHELAGGMTREGLWAQAFAESEGHPERTKARYLKLRVQTLRDEIELARQIAKADCREEPPAHNSAIRLPVGPGAALNHDSAEKMQEFERARTNLREKGFLVFRSGDGGWDVWSRVAGMPKENCLTIEDLCKLAAGK